MGKIIVLIVLLIGGISLWFYLLLGGDRTYERRETPEVPAPTHSERIEASTTASTTPTQEAPAQTDVGMEFPILEE